MKSGSSFLRRAVRSQKRGKLLPSAYFELEMKKDESVKITGGGYGHGVGMSQTAANVMAEQGYDYRKILDYFFKNITIENLG